MDFDVLRDLVQIITRNKTKQIEVLGNPGQEGSRTEKIYEAIASGNFDSDEELAKKLFGVSAKDPQYRRARNKLIRHLVNTTFFIDAQQTLFSERNAAFINCYRDFAASQILIARNAIKAGVYLLEHILDQAIKFEFTELSAEIARALRINYARGVADRNQHEYYTQIHRRYEEKRRWEMQAFDSLEELLDHYITRRSPNEEVHHLSSTYFEELYPVVQQVDTFQFYLNTYQIGLIKYFAVNDCEAALGICEEALLVLVGRKTANRGALSTIAANKLACLTQLRKFEEGDTTARFCLEMTEEGSFNWFKTMQLYLYYCFYAKRYTDALDLFRQAVQHPRYAMLNDTVRDEWQLFGGYLQLLAALKKLDPVEVEAVAGNYRYVKFSNDFLVLPKDKEGMNIPLILLPVLYSLATGEKEEYGRTTEALEKYRIRYLNNDLNRRSAAFMKILFALSDRPFRPGPADRKIAKEWEILTAERPQVAGQSFAVEIVPYEDLWEMMKPTT